MNDDKDLIPVFMPALSAILINAEDKKGSPLDADEVIEIRDNAVCMMMERSQADSMAQSRGYTDIDPENCWYDWQMLRRELGRKPDLDPGARFSYINTADEDFQKTIAEAQATLNTFRNMIAQGADEYFPLVKTLLAEADYHANMWLLVQEIKGNGFVAEIFELPGEFKQYEVGMSLEVAEQDIQDWMINDNGTLYGGYSLRYSRSCMTEVEQLEFDQHIGVERYV